jgi:Asp-tRNA(Asn)/Glu-tRNA(Gln) amidotransferase B subunit
MSDPPKRSESQTTLTISLSKVLKARIEAAAKKDARKVSNWCVVELEKILNEQEKQSASAPLSAKRPPAA